MKLNVMQTVVLAGVVLAGAAIAVTTLERPPVQSTQNGFRGVGMQQLSNPRLAMVTAARNQAPDAIAAVPDVGPKAGQLYRNVQVLGDLSVAQFARTMAAITAWVSPEQGCNYCHNPNNMASDEVYTKVVSRRMLQMTAALNTQWQDHVQQTGVTCYTCHRGQPVPAYNWSADTKPPRLGGLAAGQAGQNMPRGSVGSTSLPYDPFSVYLEDRPANIRVQASAIHPNPVVPGIKDTEWTYGLMMHMSTSLGVNCTFCHNSRNWSSWEESTPQRMTAWHGIRMVRDINTNYITPLTPQWRANPRGPEGGPVQARLGHEGDALKVNCTTCHQGVNKPLYGAPMAKDFPALQIRQNR